MDVPLKKIRLNPESLYCRYDKRTRGDLKKTGLQPFNILDSLGSAWRKAAGSIHVKTIKARKSLSPKKKEGKKECGDAWGRTLERLFWLRGSNDHNVLMLHRQGGEEKETGGMSIFKCTKQRGGWKDMRLSYRGLMWIENEETCQFR